MKALFIGLGSIGLRHVRNLLEIMDDADIIAFRQKNKPLPEDLESRIKVFLSLDDALNMKPDLAIISCPPTVQKELIMRIAMENIPFVVEKPISNSINGLDKIADIVLKNKLLSLTAFNMRFHPSFIKTKELLDTNIAGNIIHFYAQVGQYLPDWHPYEDYRKGYSALKKSGGGVCLDLIHEMDMVTYLFGRPTKINMMKSKLSNLDIETEDNCNYLLEVESGIQGMIHLDYIQRRPTRTLSIIGDSATIEVDFINCKISVFNKNAIIYNYSNPEFLRNNMYKDLMLHFINGLKNKTNFEADFFRGVEVLKWSQGIV